VRVLQPGRQTDLAQKSLRAQARQKVPREHLEDDGPIVLEVARQETVAMPPRPSRE
jgi:hypothetical protein